MSSCLYEVNHLLGKPNPSDKFTKEDMIQNILYKFSAASYAELDKAHKNAKECMEYMEQESQLNQAFLPRLSIKNPETTVDLEANVA